MSETLPLFPLGTVLYPGLLLPLHVFEERYQQLVRDLLAGPEPRTFGVIAIREGRETGPNGILTLYEIGCIATVRQVTQLSVPDLPDDPILLSYLVAASMVIDLRDKQALLAEPDALHRLVTERMLLSRETTMLRTLTATPAPDLRNSPYSSN